MRYSILVAYSMRAYSLKRVSESLKLGCWLCRRSAITYLVCSPTNIICFNVSPLTTIICSGFTYVVLSFEVSWDIQLVHANRWWCPAGTLERIEDPASPIILARVLFPCYVSMDLNHCVQNVLNMLFFAKWSKPKTEVRTCIAC